MSNAIRDTEKLFNRQLETAKRRHDRELKTLQNAHESHKTELKKANGEELVDIEDQHQRDVQTAAAKKEKVLSEMRDHIQKSQSMTEKELKALKGNAEKETIETQRKGEAQRERVIGENELYLDELNDRYSTATRQVDYDGKRRVEDKKLEMNELYAESEGQYQKKLNDQTNEFNTRFKQEGMNYKKMKDDQDNQFKKERLSTNTRQQVELAKLTNSHNSHLELRDGEFRKGLKKQDVFFEKKFQDNLKAHNEHHKALEEKNKQVMASIKENLTKEISQAASRQDDEFYTFVSLKPIMKKFEDRVEISVEVPEHAKKDLQLTTNIKEAIIGLNRRYSDANKSANGVINKVNKVESFTTRLDTGMVLNPKSVKATYENGTMTYVIQKA